MAKKKSSESSKPKFPYTVVPGSLRRLMGVIPDKPKPAKFTVAHLEGWGFTSSNERGLLTVLKAVNLLDDHGTPTPTYDAFMMTSTGPAALGAEIKKVYAPLFSSTHHPQNEQPDELKRLFNLHSGGSESTVGPQIQTFKALCEFATFDSVASGTSGGSGFGGTPNNGGSAVKPVSPGGGNTASGPTIHIDLHIHLPENKSSRDYRYIIEDIARFIYRQEIPSDEQ